MDLILRLAVVLAVIVAIALVNVAYRRGRATDAALGSTDAITGLARWPDLPAELRDETRATWIIFSTPLCVSCSAVQVDLERSFPHHAVRKIDATERPDLAELYQVRRAPTTIVADTSGQIVERLVGPEAVREFIGTAEDPALRP